MRRPAFAVLVALIVTVGVVGADPTFGSGENTVLFSDTFEDADMAEYDQVTVGSCGDAGATCTIDTVTDAAEGSHAGRVLLSTGGVDRQLAARTQDNFTLDQNQSLTITYQQKHIRTADLDGGFNSWGALILVNDAGTNLLRVRLQDNDATSANATWFIDGTMIDGTVSQENRYGVTDEYTLEYNRTVIDVSYATGFATVTVEGQEVVQAPLVENALSDDTNVSVEYRTLVVDEETHEMRVDNVTIDGGEVEVMPDHTISGTVKDVDGNPVEGATVTINTSSATDQTNASGGYSIGADNGTHLVSAEKTDVGSGSVTVTVDGADVTGQNITLLDRTLTLEVASFMEHGTTRDYQVLLGTEDVTGQATVTSSDSSVVSVDQTAETLTATSDVTVNQEVTITAEFNGTTTTENVTVANLSVENLEILPDAITRVGALFGNAPNADGDRPGGTQLTMQVLLVATMVGVAATVAASAFAGIGAMTIVLAMGWFQGWVGDGVMLGAVFTGLFIGLNLATNVDYSIRR